MINETVQVECHRILNCYCKSPSNMNRVIFPLTVISTDCFFLRFSIGHNFKYRRAGHISLGNVCDVGLTLSLQWINVSCLLGFCWYRPQVMVISHGPRPDRRRQPSWGWHPDWWCVQAGDARMYDALVTGITLTALGWCVHIRLGNFNAGMNHCMLQNNAIML